MIEDELWELAWEAQYLYNLYLPELLMRNEVRGYNVVEIKEVEYGKKTL